MKKSKAIKLVFVSAILASTIISCSSDHKEKKSNLYVRSDSTGKYTHTSHGGFYHGFYPIGIYSNGSYHKSGFTSPSSHHTSSTSSGVSRGGFGHSGFHVGS